MRCLRGLSLLRLLLLTMLLVGVATSVVGTGTHASFSASTTNGTSTFSNGTLVLSNQRSTSSACISTGGGTAISAANTNAGCDALFSGLGLQLPDDTGVSIDLTLRNEGTLTASSLRLYASQACANADTTGSTYKGAGNPCDVLQLYVQEYTSAARTTVAANGCRWGAATGGTCSFDPAFTVGAFATAHPSTGTGSLDLGPLAPSTSRWFRVFLRLPSAADNSVQGRQATFGFTWALSQ